MNINQLLSEAAIIQLLNTEDALAVASYPASGAYIDVSNYERFAFLVAAGALDSIVTCQVKQAATISGTAKDVTGAVVIIPADGDDLWYMIEVQTDNLDSNNDYNYVTLAVSGPAGANDYGAILFIGLNPRKLPVTQGATCGEVVYVAGGQTG